MVIHVDCGETERDAFAPERLLDLSPSAISYRDRDLRCRYANTACRDWLGVDPEILVGTRLVDLFAVLRLDHHDMLVDAALQGERRGVVQSLRGGDWQRQGLVQYVPDLRRSQVRGLLLQIGAMPPVSRSTL